MNFDGKVAVVTGGASGIGRATCFEFLSRNAAAPWWSGTKRQVRSWWKKPVPMANSRSSTRTQATFACGSGGPPLRGGECRAEVRWEGRVRRNFSTVVGGQVDDVEEAAVDGEAVAFQRAGRMGIGTPYNDRYAG